ncbi:hypothetical protein LH673_04740 [Morganella morganii]|uniref:hypothetical protein n=1 Tax=Morganella morganii TaxID=582 RepID=UPI001F15C403|nr:hypothetical protein [Morganella morganii]MCF1264692.1 hypothetical protein [Morganella morganii]
MEITSDQKRTICAMLAEQAGYPVRSAEITALCDDETIRAALLVLSSLIDVKYREVSAALATARAEHERNNPQMMMGSPLADSTLSAPADIPVSQPDTAHTVFPSAAEPPPLVIPPVPEEPVITDNTASAEEQAFAEIDRLSAIFGQHAFLPVDPAVPEPVVIHPGDPEPDFTFVFNEPAVAEPLNYSADNDAAGFTFVYNEPAAAPAARTAADNIMLTTSVFSDKSLFPEPAALRDPLKGSNRLFYDPDTDDTDTPVVGELPQSAQPLSATTSGNTIITDPQTPETSAGREDIPPQAAQAPVAQSAGKTAVTPGPSPDSKAPATMTQPAGQPAIRVKISRARLSESFSSPVTATLDDGRAVTILGIYFQRNIGLSFNDKTGILHGTPTEYGEFPVRVVWELVPKKRFSSDIHFAVDPGSHCTTPAPAGFSPQQ